MKNRIRYIICKMTTPYKWGRSSLVRAGSLYLLYVVSSILTVPTKKMNILKQIYEFTLAPKISGHLLHCSGLAKGFSWGSNQQSYNQLLDSMQFK